MKAIHGFLFVSYLVSIIETGALVILPVLSIYLMYEADMVLGLLALLLGVVLTALALVGLMALENAIGERVDDERVARGIGRGVAGRVRA